MQPAAYVWNGEQDLVSSTSDLADGAGSATTTYDYWSDGARVAQHLPDGSVVYYLGAMEATRNPDGSWGTIRRSVTMGSVAVASRTAEPGQGVTTSFLLGNHQGSITTTVTNGVAELRWYEPYGKSRGPKPASLPTTTGFLNQHEDTTGLTYLNNRYLDPELGTFISVDPLVTTTWEPYVYGGGNPVVFSDPAGMCATNSAEGAACYAKMYADSQKGQKKFIATLWSKWYKSLVEARSYVESFRTKPDTVGYYQYFVASDSKQAEREVANRYFLDDIGRSIAGLDDTGNGFFLRPEGAAGWEGPPQRSGPSRTKMGPTGWRADLVDDTSPEGHLVGYFVLASIYGGNQTEAGLRVQEWGPRGKAAPSRTTTLD